MAAGRLNIGHANVRGLGGNRKCVLAKYVEEYKLDIVCLCEAHLDLSMSLELGCGSKLDVFRADRNRHGGGVAILSRAEYGAVEVMLPNLRNGTEAVAVELALPRGETLCIACVYHPDGGRNMDLGLLHTLESWYDHLVVSGDFNARHTDWGINVASNANGRSLSRFLTENSAPNRAERRTNICFGFSRLYVDTRFISSFSVRIC